MAIVFMICGCQNFLSVGQYFMSATQKTIQCRSKTKLLCLLQAVVGKYDALKQA